VVPLQVPSVVVSVWPCCGVPETCGSAVLTGGVASTVAVWSLVAKALPASLVAVTVTRIVEAGELTSACWTT
jgi:hypothetical protein